MIHYSEQWTQQCARIWSDNLQLPYTRRLKVIWDQMTSNFLVYNPQLPHTTSNSLMVAMAIMVSMVMVVMVVMMVMVLMMIMVVIVVMVVMVDMVVVVDIVVVVDMVVMVIMAATTGQDGTN